MPATTPAPRTRRNLLGNAVAGAATGALIGGCAITIATPETLPIRHEPHPDTDVLIACRDFDELERRSIRAYAGATTWHREQRADRITDAVRARQRPILDRILSAKGEPQCWPRSGAGIAQSPGPSIGRTERPKRLILRPLPCASIPMRPAAQRGRSERASNRPEREQSLIYNHAKSAAPVG